MKQTIGTGRSVHLMTVNNDNDGQALIETLRKNMVGSPTRIARIHGRGFRYGKGKGTKANDYDNTYQEHLPRHLSQRLSVYITGRKA